MAKGTAAKVGDPREWLRKKLGEADYAEFEKGLIAGAKAAAKKPKDAAAEVEGQAPCAGYCWSNCSNIPMQSGFFSSWFRIV